MVVGLPCAMRGGYAHGSRTMTATDSAVPHDSAVPADTERARVCNTHHLRQKRALAEPARNDPTRLIRPAPRTTPPGTTTPETLTNTHPASDVMTHHNLEPGYDRTRRGTRPISTRVTTDLEAEADRSRRGVRPISARRGAVRRGRRTAPASVRISPRRASAPAPARTGVRSRCRSRPRASRRRWRSSWRRPTACS